jgi:hypothetical protein
MNGIARGRILCRYQRGDGHRCDRPAVGNAWNRYEAAYLPICLPCADRIDVPVTPYRQPVTV